MFYRYPTKHGIDAINIRSLEFIALFHTIAAILLVVFLITHLYLITTGDTVTSNLRAMLTGYEELEDASDDYIINDNPELLLKEKE
jgi:cytochrome b subunit of formate dehydrogenase